MEKKKTIGASILAGFLFILFKTTILKI